jgi:HEAT repeat protein
MAVESAGMTGARWAIRKIVKLLDHPYTELRRAACVALGRLEAYGAVEKLVEKLKDPDKEVRTAAIEALGRTGGRRALAACAILLADRSPEVAAVAADCLARQARYDWELARHAGRQLAAMLRLKADPILAAAAARALAVVGVKDNRKAMLRLLRLTLHPRAKCRKEAAWALGFVGRSDIRETRRCIERLFNRDSSLEVRLHAGLAAGRLKMRKILPHLAKLFRAQKGDKQLVPRLIAAMGLAMMERGWRQEAIRLFLRVASSRPNLPEKIRLVEMMASLGTKWSRSALRRALTSPNAMVRAEIRRVLGIKPPPPVPPPPDSSWPAHAAPSTEPAGRKPGSKAGPMRPVQSNRSIAGPFPLPKESRQAPRRGCGCGCRTAATRALGGSPLFLGLVWLALVILLTVILRNRFP